MGSGELVVDIVCGYLSQDFSIPYLYDHSSSDKEIVGRGGGC